MGRKVGHSYRIRHLRSSGTLLDLVIIAPRVVINMKLSASTVVNVLQTSPVIRADDRQWTRVSRRSRHTSDS